MAISENATSHICVRKQGWKKQPEAVEQDVVPRNPPKGGEAIKRSVVSDLKNRDFYLQLQQVASLFKIFAENSLEDEKTHILLFLSVTYASYLVNVAVYSEITHVPVDCFVRGHLSDWTPLNTNDQRMWYFNMFLFFFPFIELQNL